MCEDTSSPVGESVDTTYLQILGQEKGEGNGSAARCGNLLLKYKGGFIDRISVRNQTNRREPEMQDV